MDRRAFVAAGLGSFTLAIASPWRRGAALERAIEAPAFSVQPVVGDGRWIWTKPPENERGFLEPRPFKLSIGIELEGRGRATNIVATTPVPAALPEQHIQDVQLAKEGCDASLREIADAKVGQLVLSAQSIERGQRLLARVDYRLSLLKQYVGHTREHFPVEQSPPADVTRTSLGDSPGIATRIAEVRALAEQIVADAGDHPWDRATAICEWVRDNIAPQLGTYTSVTAALRTRRGDCEEMAGVFVAVARALNIPARMVWVPNHAWAEFFLVDGKGYGHWIPAHTACYPWFGWTGVHELVLQKGDRLQIPGRRGYKRLMDDWARWQGRSPAIRFTAELEPLAAEDGGDPGPGARRKDERGSWNICGTHALDKVARA